jgi:hypothetical protein
LAETTGLLRSPSTSAFGEHSTACWQTNDRVLIGASTEEEDPHEVIETKAPELRLRPRGIAVYDVVSSLYMKSVVLDEPAE